MTDESKSLVELWNSILLSWFKPNYISNNRTRNCLENKRLLGRELLTTIDDPYHAAKGIRLYLALRGKTSLRMRGGNELIDSWNILLRKPKNFPEFQRQLIALWIYGILYNSEINKGWYLSGIDLYYALELLFNRWERGGLLYVDRRSFGYLIGSIYGLEVPSDDKKLYEWLGELQDLMSTMNMSSTVPFSQHRIRPLLEYSKDKTNKKSVFPGRAFDIMPTLVGLYLYKNLGIIRSSIRDSGLKEPNEIFEYLNSKLWIIQKYSESLVKCVKGCLDESRKSPSGVAISEISENIENEIGGELIRVVSSSNVILKHDIMSVALWYSIYKDLRLDILQLNNGLLRIVG